MKLRALVGSVALAFSMLLIAACTPAEKKQVAQVAQAGLTALDYICVIEAAVLPDGSSATAAAVMSICKIDQQYGPDVERVIAAQQGAAARIMAAKVRK